MPRPIQIGVQLPEVERPVRWSEIADIARAAEDIGLNSIWTGDHLLYREEARYGGPWETWSILAGLATVTSRVSIGPLVAATSFHNPAMLAKKAATVDEMSGGRLVLGLGAGWNEVEYRAYGFPYDQRVSRFEEGFTIIRTLLREGQIDFDGHFYQLRDCELVPQGPRPGAIPLLIGSSGPRMLSIALPYVQAWNSWYTDFDNRAELVGGLIDRVDGVARSVGRDPSTIEKTLAVKVRLPGAIGARDSDNVAPLEGDSETVADELRKYAVAGVGTLQLVLDPITAASVERLGPVLEFLERQPA